MYKKTNQFIFWALCLLARGAMAQGTAPVPTKLFGIELGSMVPVDRAKASVDHSQIPIKAFRGMESGFGYGAHYYFEPISVNPSLPYKEGREAPADEYYKTSYRLYLLPVPPKGAKSLVDFEKSITHLEVLAINWEELEVKRNAYARDSKEEKEARRADYWWALSLCKTFSTEFAVKPKILDLSDSDNYICEFTQDERTFEVSSFYRKSVRLVLRRDLSDKKNDDFGTAFRQLEARELLK